VAQGEGPEFKPQCHRKKKKKKERKKEGKEKKLLSACLVPGAGEQ
jgi:hypothetical protein